MCGIFGLIAARGASCDKAAFHDSLIELFRLSEPRGREAGGLVIAAGGEAQVYKRPITPSKMLASSDFKAFVKSSEAAYRTDPEGRAVEPFAAIGHCRLVTNGTETVVGNNQPVITQASVGVHNGIIANEDDLWAANGDLQHSLDTDTEIVYRLIDKHMAAGCGTPKSVARTFADLNGTASIAFFRNDARTMTLATNNGSLYTLHLADLGVFVFASERYILEQFIARGRFAYLAGKAVVENLSAGTGMVIDFDTAAPRSFSVDEAEEAPEPSAASGLVIRDLTDHLSGLQRCTRCILPVTYPYIEFDDDGVCNYCRDHTPAHLKGLDALEHELAKHRSSDGSPDCIVAISGGRDSSYGQHMIKAELGMNPIAFTYDWGMVTDLARRNQARMCGQLGMEHILRAADIPAKRRYIRKNIHAWLARPKLGMIPLFMAGDKYFYHHARQLRKETGIKLMIFCAGNELERTDFKSGFAGVRETAGHRNRLFGFSMANKVGLAAWYAMQYVLNPRYLNESFADTMGAFFQTFIAKDDFLYLYDYLEWNEDTINKTLIGTYGWETAKDSDNTWRIGDGYTSFINYIYHSVAGFSEYDTFRSNQIREGLIGRDEALRLAREDNEPKLDVLYDFARQTGFNLEEVLTRINSIDKLY
ncbi:MAG: hypothetical protein ACTSV1_03015 [Alphaproteobacteria bacterium]